MNKILAKVQTDLAFKNNLTFNPVEAGKGQWNEWVCESDERVCDLCEANRGTVRSLSHKWEKEPPLHINCRCEIRPINAIITGSATIDGKNGVDGQLFNNVASMTNLLGRKYDNSAGKLPDKNGRTWYETDINLTKDGMNNSHHLVYSNDGLVFVTYDGYKRFFEVVNTSTLKVNPDTGYGKKADGELVAYLKEMYFGKFDNGEFTSKIIFAWISEKNRYGITGGVLYYKGSSITFDYGEWDGGIAINKAELDEFIKRVDEKKEPVKAPIQASDESISFIKSYEDFSPVPYRGLDSQNLTIGYGHVMTGDEIEKYKNGISEEEAIELLKKDLEDKVYKYLDPWIEENSVKLTQQQYDALVIFTFNAGPSWITEYEDLRSILKRGNITYEAMYNEFMTWIKVNDEPSLGLYRRRMDELNIFFKGDYNRDYPNWPEGGV
jgi:GH24 family phage-related lysozyme (muramidase)